MTRLLASLRRLMKPPRPNRHVVFDREATEVLYRGAEEFITRQFNAANAVRESCGSRKLRHAHYQAAQRSARVLAGETLRVRPLVAAAEEVHVPGEPEADLVPHLRTREVAQRARRREERRVHALHEARMRGLAKEEMAHLERCATLERLLNL